MNRSVLKTVAGSFLVVSLSCVSFFVSMHFVRMPPAWYTFEFCQYAEIGKNLATEGRFDTRLVEPMALAYIDHNRIGPPGPRWPVVNRYPLPCVVIAALMKFLGPTDRAAACSNGLAVGALAVLAFVLARRWYGAGWSTIVAMLVVANPAIYGQFILLGTPDVWFALLFALELVAWCRLVDGDRGIPKSRLALLTGVLAGLSYLARFNVVVFLAPQLAYMLLQRRWRDSATLATTAAIVAAPMAVYNVRHFGTPTVGVYSAWNLLDGIGVYRVEPWLYYRVPSITAELRAHIGGFATKFWFNLTRVVPVRIWNLWHLDLILPLAILGLLIGRRNDQATVSRRFLVWSAGLFVFQLILFSALRLELEDRLSPHHGRYFFWFAVPAMLLGVGALKRLTEWSRWWRILTTVVVVGQLAIFGVGWSRWVKPGPIDSTNLGRDPIRVLLGSIANDQGLIASNQPQLTSWFWGKKTVSLPADPDELARLNRESTWPIDYIIIDTNFNSIAMDMRWATLLKYSSFPLPWERQILVDYEYALEPDLTRPVGYVLFRRRAVPPTLEEQKYDEIAAKRRRSAGTGPASHSGQ